MGSMLKKMKKERKPSSPLNLKHMEAYNRGFAVGAAEQRKLDIESVVKMLEGLEELPGIGDKTAWKIRKMFMKCFEKGGSESERNGWN